MGRAGGHPFKGESLRWKPSCSFILYVAVKLLKYGKYYYLAVAKNIEKRYACGVALHYITARFQRGREGYD